MRLTNLIAVFTLSFAAFTISVLSGWVAPDILGTPGEGAVLGALSSLFLALILTERRAFIGKTILSGALAGLLAYPLAAWLQASWGGFLGGAFFGLALGAAHWSLNRREVKPLWAIVLMFSWGLGLGGLESWGAFYGLFLGAVLFALVNTFAAAQPLRIVQGWATQTNRRGPRNFQRPAPAQAPFRRRPRTKTRAQTVKNGLVLGRAPARKRG